MTFSIKSFIATNGERFSLLLDAREEGIPMYYPTIFISHEMRENHTHQTQQSALNGIRRLCQWESERGLLVEEKLANGELLQPHEIADLAAHVRTSRMGKKGEAISAEKFNIYWLYIQRYIAWLTDVLLPNRDSIHVQKLVEDQAARLKKRELKRGASRARKKQRLLDEKLPELARAKLLSLFDDPLQGIEAKPQHHGTRLRNIVMIRILYETGMRRGELLSLKLKHSVEASGGEGAYLVIERNHGDELDLRANQPVAKTLGRDVAISEGLEKQILDYRVIRAGLNNAGHSESSFLFCVHQRGKTEGQALSINGFNSAFLYFRNAFPVLGKSLHPHALRHDWNYRFSKQADDAGMSEADEASSREQAMGWAPGSDMAKIYNQRHRREQAMAIGRKVAEDTMRASK